MPPKKPAKAPVNEAIEIEKEIEIAAHSLADTGSSFETYLSVPPPTIKVSLMLDGNPAGAGEWKFLAVFNARVILEGAWHHGNTYKNLNLPLDLKQFNCQQLVAEKPLILLLRSASVKGGARDPDPLLNIDNRAGACVDLFPLIIGEDNVNIHTPLINITTGEIVTCSVKVYARTTEPFQPDDSKTVLTITMISGHCLPFSKEGTVYIAAIGLDGVTERVSVKFEMSLSNSNAEKYVWASASQIYQAATTSICIFNDDVFVPEGLPLKKYDNCRNYYWYATKRVLVDPEVLKERLSNALLIELAGVPKAGKIDVRGRYMGYIDAGALLEPDQTSLSTSACLLFYNESDVPKQQEDLLDLPVTSAKASGRTTATTNMVFDEDGHHAFVIIRFDLLVPLEPKVKMAVLFETIGIVPPEGPSVPVDELEVEPPPENAVIDVGRIRKEGGALAVHEELSRLACMGTVPMNQGIKRTAANRLLMRVRSMLKQFPPGDCSYIEWQDTVTRQHVASRRAVTSSFAPQPPPLRPPARMAAARSRIAGDERIADTHIRWNLEHASGQPRALISKALRLLEEGNDLDANDFILRGLQSQPKNRFLLWIFGSQQYNKESPASAIAAAALRIAVKGDYSAATANAIGWAALHTLHHTNDNHYAAFTAAKRMRKSYELRRDWKKFYQRWVNTSGEEEMFWRPELISPDNPFLIAAAFFLCLKCFEFSESLLKCLENGCANCLKTAEDRSCRSSGSVEPNADVYYLRAASLLQRRQFEEALKCTLKGIKMFGPLAIMSQMQAMCLICIRGWDDTCQKAVVEAESFGFELSPTILLRAAEGSFFADPKRALQWAARAHKIAPSAHSALWIGRIYDRLGEVSLAERWASAAVKTEPLLADGWAVLALLAMYERNVDKARTMLRTARQAGPLSPDIEEHIKKVMELTDIEVLPDSLVKNLCFCEYF